jgi:hypothetical protein
MAKNVAFSSGFVRPFAEVLIRLLGGLTLMARKDSRENDSDDDDELKVVASER